MSSTPSTTLEMRSHIFINRQRELQTLEEFAEAVRSGLGRSILIVGEAGIGKTHLVREWMSHSRAELTWVVARARSDTQDRAYYLLRRLASALMGVTFVSEVEGAHEAALDLLADRIGKISEAAQSADLISNLAHNISLELSAHSWDESESHDPQARQTQYLDAVTQLMLAWAKDKPLVLILENLQWADASSLDVISRLVPLVRRAPILFCLTARMERQSAGWRMMREVSEDLGGLAQQITIESLSTEDSAELLRTLAPFDTPDHLAEMIQTRAEGNPLFIEQILANLAESEAIRQGEMPVDLRLPESLRALLDDRINRLPHEIRGLLQCASVIGREFSVTVLENMSTIKTSPEDLRSQLSEIEAADLISLVRTQPDLVYRFRHALLYEAVRSSLTDEQAPRLHGAAGEALEQMYPEEQVNADLAVRLARHFREAGDKARSLKYLLVAGGAALATYANVEAEKHLRAAQDLAESREDRSTVLAQLGRALARQSRFDEALKVWQEAILIFEQLGQLDSMAEFYARSARVAWNADDLEGSLDLCQRGLLATQTAAAGRGRARLLHEAARAKFFNAELQGVRELAESALAMAEQVSAPLVLAETYSTLGLLPEVSTEQAIEYQEKSIQISERAGLLSQASRAHANLGQILAERSGDRRAAREEYLQAARIEGKRGNLFLELFSLSNASYCAILSGDVSRAAVELDVFEQRVSGLKNPGVLLHVHHINRSLLLRMHGDAQGALDELAAAHEQAHEKKGAQLLLINSNYIAELLLEAGSMQSLQVKPGHIELDHVLREAIESVDQGIGYSTAWSRSLLVMHQAEQGRFTEAEQTLEAAELLSQKYPYAVDAAWLGWAKARLAASKQDWRRAFKLYQLTCDEFAKLTMSWWQAGALREWAELCLQRGEAGDLEQAQRNFTEAARTVSKLGLDIHAQTLEARLQQVSSRQLEESHALEAASRELADAGKIQTDFLPTDAPEVPGWQLAARLVPAKQASGDYYDFIELPEDRLAIVIADVADKGAGAALYMASSRTLIRTFADQHPDRPDLVLQQVNRRILKDTHAGYFLTAFYAVLDPVTGELKYANAGHLPPLVVGVDAPVPLRRTGAPLGVYEDADWELGQAGIGSGSALLLYTDGVTEAQNDAGEFFGEARLLQAVSRPTPTARELVEELFSRLAEFTGRSAQSDDRTVVALMRK